MTDLNETLRHAIKASGKSMYAIARETGIAGSVLSRYASGEQASMNIDTAEKLADALGLKIVVTPRKGGRKATRKE